MARLWRPLAQLSEWMGLGCWFSGWRSGGVTMVVGLLRLLEPVLRRGAIDDVYRLFATDRCCFSPGRVVRSVNAAGHRCAACGASDTAGASSTWSDSGA